MKDSLIDEKELEYKGQKNERDKMKLGITKKDQEEEGIDVEQMLWNWGWKGDNRRKNDGKTTQSRDKQEYIHKENKFLLDYAKEMTHVGNLRYNQ
jgi:hypothetical protein